MDEASLEPRSRKKKKSQRPTGDVRPWGILLAAASIGVLLLLNLWTLGSGDELVWKLIALLRLGASTAHIALPVLYAGQRMRFPRQLIHGDLASIERTCIEAISDAVIAGLKQDLSPEW